jgi:hypothetical protein
VGLQNEMKSKVHFSLMRLKSKDVSACGIDLNKADTKVSASVDLVDVNCRTCKRTKVFKEELCRSGMKSKTMTTK